MATLGSETWTGTTGAAWPAQWVNGSNQGTATIQANAGRLLADGTGYRRIHRFLNVPAVGKSEVYVEATVAALTEHYGYVFLRSNSAIGDVPYPNGYGVVLTPNATTYTMELADGQYGEYIQTTAPLTYTVGGKLGIRMGVDGTTFRSKVWPLTASEPASWVLTSVDTDNAYPSGRLELGYLSGAANPGITFDNMVLTDGAAAVASPKGSMMLAF